VCWSRAKKALLRFVWHGHWFPASHPRILPMPVRVWKASGCVALSPAVWLSLLRWWLSRQLGAARTHRPFCSLGRLSATALVNFNREEHTSIAGRSHPWSCRGGRRVARMYDTGRGICRDYQGGLSGQCSGTSPRPAGQRRVSSVRALAVNLLACRYERRTSVSSARNGCSAGAHCSLTWSMHGCRLCTPLF
jgi:hypothetical protein